MKTSPSSNHPRTFSHEPLDCTKQSIRLIQIESGLLAEGLIRCQISHETIETRYICLSYRWGDEDHSTSRIILVNGKSFTVRQNLYNFLYLACSEHEWLPVTQTRYWIDALCINQSDRLERNHQVAQMGNIFAGAELVHIWLGKTTDIHHLSTFLSSLFPINRTHTKTKELQRNMQLIGQLILHNEYWNRAWVVQEIVLAQEVVISLNSSTHSLFEFFEMIRRLDLDITQTPYLEFIDLWCEPLKADLCNKSLLFLLYWFRDKHCSLPHDRVFSLLAICLEADRIEVDYDMRWTYLAVHVLKNPQHQLCICSVALVAKSLAPHGHDPRTGNGVYLAEPMLSFDGSYMKIEFSEYVKSVYPYGDALPVSWRRQFRCLQGLMTAFYLLFGRSLLKSAISMDATPDTPLIEAIHQTVRLGRVQLLWERDPHDESRRWYRQNGWEIGICHTNPDFCRVRIAFNKLQEVYPTKSSCAFSDSGHSERSNLFEIEWAEWTTVERE